MLRAFISDIVSIPAEIRSRKDRFWDEVDRLDRVRWSNDWELWNALSEEARAIFNEGLTVYPHDKPQALARFEASAALGNPVAMVWAGRLHASGAGTAPDRDRACAFFSDAIDAGSWNATLWYAREMHSLGYPEVAFETLAEGVDADHVPSFFWLAWLRYKTKRTSKEARAVLPLIDYAIERDHRAGTWLKGKLMMAGKLGLARIPAGFRFAIRNQAIFKVEHEDHSGGTNGES